MNIGRDWTTFVLRVIAPHLDQLTHWVSISERASGAARGGHDAGFW